MAEKGFSGALLYAKDDQIVFNNAYGLADRQANVSFTTRTRVPIGEMTQLFTAVAILQLQDQGRLDVNDSICDYLQNCPENWNAASIHHLLIGSSGIQQIFASQYFEIAHGIAQHPQRVVDTIQSSDLQYEPGAMSFNLREDYLLLGLVIEAASGQSYEDYLQENIFDPLGMTDTQLGSGEADLAHGYTNNGNNVNTSPDLDPLFSRGGLTSTIEDLFRFGQAIVSEELLSKESMELLFSPHLNTRNSEWYLGYGWVVSQDYFPDTLFAEKSTGILIDGYQGALILMPDLNYVEVTFTNEPDADLDGQIYENLTEIAMGLENDSLSSESEASTE